MEGKRIKKMVTDKILPNLIVFLSAVFLIYNVVVSQIVSTSYFQLINDDKKSIILYLQKIKSLSIFSDELSKYQKVYGNQIVSEVFKDDVERDIQIKRLTTMLDRNQYSRDVLFALYTLNLEKGDKITASKYLIQASTVDPSVK